jgi:FkbM family methyltransferase
MISQHYFTFPLYIPRTWRLFKNWPEYLFNYLLRRQQPAEYRLRNGDRLIDSAGTMAGTLAVVYLRREYGLPHDARVIVDIGANMGCFSVFAAQLCQAATVLCYEPESGNFERLNKNITVNHLQGRVHAYQYAVSGDGGTKELSLGESPLNSLVINSPSQRRQRVDCITLSDIIANQNLLQIDFLKLNCEGAEYEIIEQCPESDIVKLRKIRLEYHNFGDKQRNGRYLVGLLKQRGFTIERFTTYRNESGFIWASREG